MFVVIQDVTPNVKTCRRRRRRESLRDVSNHNSPATTTATAQMSPGGRRTKSPCTETHWIPAVQKRWKNNFFFFFARNPLYNIILILLTYYESNIIIILIDFQNIFKPLAIFCPVIEMPIVVCSNCRKIIIAFGTRHAYYLANHVIIINNIINCTSPSRYTQIRNYYIIILLCDTSCLIPIHTNKAID